MKQEVYHKHFRVGLLFVGVLVQLPHHTHSLLSKLQNAMHNEQCIQLLFSDSHIAFSVSIFLFLF